MNRAIVALILAISVIAVACTSPSPDVPTGSDGEADPALVTGREIYEVGCVQCHGADGGGGRGPRLNRGSVVDAFPDLADEIAVIADGKGGMPSFGQRLTAADIEAVTRYTREVLSDID